MTTSLSLMIFRLNLSIASNAEERAEERIKGVTAIAEKDKKLPEVQKDKMIQEQKKKFTLNENEALTLSIVIRELNDHGIVWTDLKSKNFQIASDPNVPTDSRIIFFDFDGFWPVKGSTPNERAAAARDIQKAFDAPRMESNKDNGWNHLRGALGIVYDKYYKDELKEKLKNDPYNFPSELGFDFSFLNLTEMPPLASPTENEDLGMFILLNAMDKIHFQDHINKFNKGKEDNKRIDYTPKN